MENKVPNQTWIRPKSTGMEVEEDNDLDSVFKETVDEILEKTETLEPAIKYVDVIKLITPQEVAENLKNMAEIMTPEEHAKLQGVEQPKIKTKTRAPKATTGKTATPEEMIALMEAKIEALRSISKLEWTGGTGNSDTPKAIREVLIGIASDVENLKAKYTEIISAI